MHAEVREDLKATGGSLFNIVCKADEAQLTTPEAAEYDRFIELSDILATLRLTAGRPCDTAAVQCARRCGSRSGRARRAGGSMAVCRIHDRRWRVFSWKTVSHDNTAAVPPAKTCVGLSPLQPPPGHQSVRRRSRHARGRGAFSSSARPLVRALHFGGRPLAQGGYGHRAGDRVVAADKRRASSGAMGGAPEVWWVQNRSDPRGGPHRSRPCRSSRFGGVRPAEIVLG